MSAATGLSAPDAPSSSSASNNSGSSTAAELVNKAGPEESLKAFKLLEALRDGDQDQILPFLTESAPPAQQSVSETGVLSESGTSTPLHLAVRCAKFATVDFVLKHQPHSLVAQDGRGQTPVHLAAALDRRDVLQLLLNQDGVDDMIRDASGKTCLEVASTGEAAALIQVSRGRVNELFIANLAAYIASPTADSSSPSTNRLSPHASTSPPATGGPPPRQISAASGHVSNAAAENLYHFIAKSRSSCIDFSQQDPASGTTILHEAVKRKDLGIIKLVLSRGGDVLARDRKGKFAADLTKDERLRSVLRQAVTTEGKALKAAATALAGASSATLAAKPARLAGFLSKYVNLAKGYRSRWFVLENGILSYYHSQEEEGKASRGSINMAVAELSPPSSEKLKFTISNQLGRSMPSFYLKGNHPVEVMRWIDHLQQHVDYARSGPALTKATSTSSATSIPSIVEPRTSFAASRFGEGRSPHSPADSIGGSIDGDDDTFNGDADNAPHAEDFHLLAQGTKAQLELAQQLLSSKSGQQADVQDALKRSLATLEQLLDDYVDVVGQRERFYQRKYDKELEAKRMWEESMKEVVAQHTALESELQKASRDNTRRKRALQEVRANLGAASPGLGASPRISLQTAEEERPILAQLKEDGSQPLPSPLRSPSLAAVQAQHRSRANTFSLSPTRARTRAGTLAQPLNPVELEQLVDSALANEEGEVSEDEDTDDEFFEAIESGQLPFDSTEKGEDAAPTPVPERSAPAKELEEKLDLEPYKGYEKLRSSLPITSDNRPSVSLWAILKGSIGKDLTKISFPVYFNEPTSMLERMAEDMEFSECLDAAAAESDSTKRIAFVAAFAMSNYSSTIGRIAKPFNPMLSETFEYVDPKKKYRYISEQVSHHPPISACIGQSPSWEYSGCVDAKSKFLGKSFEIRPTGVAHVTLRIPEAWAHPDCPPSKTVPSLRDEHYSWVKVTTGVSGFLTGSPTIDHYGDMVVTNHRTGETCTLTFKPRGWRGEGREIKGEVKDVNGRKHFDIAGKWSSQLVARRAGAGSGELEPDASVPTNKAGEVAPEYIRLWKNSVKPPGMPFNLTPYAITLNDINDDLKPWLPPTDCRLRPDQHAFESGKFERANDLKTELEEHQRETRRKREKGELPPHAPRWFSRTVDRDTGEMFWEPARAGDGRLEYWEERTRLGKAKRVGERAEWPGVDPIYGEFQV